MPMKTVNFRTQTLMLILAATLLRMFMAMGVDLGNDEVYYRQFAKPLEWNYFDHPPMIGWLIRLTTFNLNLDYPVFIRLGAIISAAATSWMLYLTGTAMRNERTGFFAVGMYTATLYGSIIAGTFILPDSPQVFFWSSALYVLIQLIQTGPEASRSNRLLLWFGLFTGFALLCKVHSVFLWGGWGAYMLLHDRRWLKKPILYVAGFITIACFAPVIAWNIQHDFITYRFHSNRVNDLSGGFNHNTLIQFLLGQIFYGSLILFPFFMGSIGRGWRSPKNEPERPMLQMLIWCGIPLMLTALYLSCFNPVLPHWTGPAYLSLCLLAAVQMDRKTSAAIAIPTTIRWALGLTAFIIIAGWMFIQFYPGTTGKREHAKFGQGDATLDLYGWNQLEQKMKNVWENDKKNGSMKPNAFVVTNRWYPGAHLDYYICRPNNRTLLIWGEPLDIHQYLWINPTRPQPKPGDDAYCITPSNNTLSVEDVYGQLFKEIVPADTIAILRNGDTAKLVFVQRLKGYKTK